MMSWFEYSRCKEKRERACLFIPRCLNTYTVASCELRELVVCGLYQNQRMFTCCIVAFE